jgi:hypothetical protein
LEATASANSDEASAFTDDEIAGNILIMVLAGEDTTANAWRWLMHRMAEHAEVQCPMQTEAHRVLCEAERPPTFESLSAPRYHERDIRRALVSALDNQALHFNASMALQTARPLDRAPRSQPSIDWTRARLMELVCRGLTNKEIRPRVVYQSNHHEGARRPPETRARAPGRVC